MFDINLRQDFYSEETVRASLEQADILKLNEDELPVVAGMLSLHGDADSQLEQLRQRYDLRYIVYTLGSRGSRVTAPDDFSVMETARSKSPTRSAQATRSPPPSSQASCRAGRYTKRTVGRPKPPPSSVLRQAARPCCPIR